MNQTATVLQPIVATPVTPMTTTDRGLALIDRQVKSGALNLTTKQYDQAHLDKMVLNLKRATDKELGGHIINPIPENADNANGFDRNNKYVKVWTDFNFYGVNLRNYYQSGMNKHDFVYNEQLMVDIMAYFKPHLLGIYPNYKDDYHLNNNEKHLNNAYKYRLEGLFNAFVIEELTMALLVKHAKRVGHTDIKVYQSYYLDMVGIDSYVVLDNRKALAIHNISGSKASEDDLQTKNMHRNNNDLVHKTVDFGGSYDFGYIKVRLEDSVFKIFNDSRIYFPNDIDYTGRVFTNNMQNVLINKGEKEMFLLHS